MVDYDQHYAIIELIGEWNDAIYNDIMMLKRDVIDIMLKQGITKYILIAENVLNFHSSDSSYYEEWFEEVSDEGGWIVCLNMPIQTQYDFKKARLNYYVELLNYAAWRTTKPDFLFGQLDSMIMNRLGI